MKLEETKASTVRRNDQLEEMKLEEKKAPKVRRNESRTNKSFNGNGQKK